MKKNSKMMIAVIALAAVAALMAGAFLLTRPDTQQGSKTVTVEVVHKDGSSKEFTYHTDEEYLGAVLLNEGLVEGKMGAFGLYILKVDGEVADFSVDGGWWCLTKGGEMTTSGADTTPIADGDAFELIYTVG